MRNYVVFSKQFYSKSPSFPLLNFLNIFNKVLMNLLPVNIYENIKSQWKNDQAQKPLKHLYQCFQKSAPRTTVGPLDQLRWSTKASYNSIFWALRSTKYFQWLVHKKSMGTTDLYNYIMETALQNRTFTLQLFMEYCYFKPESYPTELKKKFWGFQYCC